jgi:hypothetical protein
MKVGRIVTCTCTYLGLDQDKINEEHNEIMLDVFIGKSLAMGALGQANSFAKCRVIGFAVLGIQRVDWISTFDTDGHDPLFPESLGSLRRRLL